MEGQPLLSFAQDSVVRVVVEQPQKSNGHSIEFPSLDEQTLFKDGLTTHQATKRLEQYGFNFVGKKRIPKWKLLIQKSCWGPTAFLIEFAIVVSFLNIFLGTQTDWLSFGGLVVFFFINGFFSFNQELKVIAGMDSLKEMLSPQCLVKRDRVWQTIDTKLLVPGDLILLKPGDKVPADCKLSMKGHPLQIDETEMKTKQIIHPGEVCRCGSVIQRGEIEALVLTTGANTFYGKTIAGIEENQIFEGHIEDVLTNIAKGKEKIVRLPLTPFQWLSLLLSHVFYVGADYMLVLTFCSVLLVATLPRGMKRACRVRLAVDSRQLAEHSIIVSKLAVMESMAGMTVLLSNKTGTLTSNKLEMRAPWVLPGITEEEIIFFAGLATNKINPDGIDLCILEAISDGGKASQFEELSFIPMDPSNKKTEVTLKGPRGVGMFKVAKGAPQVILNMVHNKNALNAQVQLKVRVYAERGLRTVGVARCKVEPERESEDVWEMMGILSFHDPPREDSEDTVALLAWMGADVKMVTGDHVLIGKETARLLRMGSGFCGKEFLDHIDAGNVEIANVNVCDIVEASDGFAQIAPRHREFLVKELQRLKYKTAITGEGVADVPALEKADIGIAVEGACEAAKEASDIVLLKPGISSIIPAIVQSRRMFQRMKNYCTYRIVCSLNLLFYVTMILGLNLFIPKIMVMMIAIFNQIVTNTLFYDRVQISTKPQTWKIPLIIVIAVMISGVTTIGLFLMYYLYTHPFGDADENIFGFKFHPLCFYVRETDKQRQSIHEYVCSAQCPGYVEKDATCGDYVGWSETLTVIFLTLSIGGQLSVFVARTKHSMFTTLPGFSVVSAFTITQLIITIIGMYCPIVLDIHSTVNIKGVSPYVPVIMKGVGMRMTGIVWLYSICLLLVKDLIKVSIYDALDNDANPTKNIFKSKREKKPLLPKWESMSNFQKKRKSQQVGDNFSMQFPRPVN